MSDETRCSDGSPAAKVRRLSPRRGGTAARASPDAPLSRPLALSAPTRPLDLFYSLVGGEARVREAAKRVSSAAYREPRPADVAAYTTALLSVVQTATDPAVDLAGITVGARNRFGVTLLHKTLRYPNWRTSRYLIERDASLCRAKDDLGRVPLHDACWNEGLDFEVIDLLLKDDPWLLVCADNRGHTPLCYAPRASWTSWTRFFGERRRWIDEAFAEHVVSSSSSSSSLSSSSSSSESPPREWASPGPSDSEARSSDSDGGDGGGGRAARVAAGGVEGGRRKRPRTRSEAARPAACAPAVAEKVFAVSAGPKTPAERWAEVARSVVASRGVRCADDGTVVGSPPSTGRSLSVPPSPGRYDALFDAANLVESSSPPR